MKSLTNLEPKTKGFVETSSLVGRLRAVMFAVAVLIVVGFGGIYFTNHPFVAGLQKLNAANLTLTALTAAQETLDTADAELDNLTKSKNPKDVHFVFNEANKLGLQNLELAISHSADQPEVQKRLIQLRAQGNLYVQNVEELFDKIAQRKLNREEIQAELLVSREFSSDIRETLRSTFLEVKDKSDLLFRSIYESRFKPLIVALILSGLFLGFVVIFGFSLTNRIRRSLGNLSAATAEISHGNFNYQAKVLNADEIGNVTYAFNQMVQALRQQREDLRLTADRITNLQGITAAFSEALTPDQVFNILIDKGLKIAGADAGSITTLTEDQSALIFHRMSGYDIAMPEYYPLNQHSPIADAVRFSHPIFIEDLEQLLQKYPSLSREKSHHSQATVVLPLSVGSEVLGTLVFSFIEPRQFTEAEKQFLIAMARQSAQALHRSQLFENARKAIMARDEFLSIASHELKTPLTPLKLQLQGLARQVQIDGKAAVQPEKITKIVENSDKQINRLARLIEDLLDVSRISAGRLTLRKEKLCLNELIDEVVKHYSHQLKDVLGDIRVQAQAQVEGELDRVRIEQVLINLLTNAGKYAPGRPVDIGLTAKDGKARLTVKDQGPGIMPQDQARIFDRFERVRNRDNIGGLGLGLYISKQIIEAHGGKISVDSIPGSGATFIVEIPLNHTATAEHSQYPYI